MIPSAIRIVLLVALALSSNPSITAKGIGNKRDDQVTFVCTHNGQSFKPKKRTAK